MSLTIAKCAVFEKLEGLHLPPQDSHAGIDTAIEGRAEGYVGVALADEGALVLVGEQITETGVHSTGSAIACAKVQGGGIEVTAQSFSFPSFPQAHTAA